MINDILSAVRSLEGVEEITITVTTVTAKTASTNGVVTTTGDERIEAAPSSDAVPLSHSHLAVLAAVRAGHTRPTEIEEAIGLKHRRVADLLKQLVESGHLTQPRYGRYQAAA